MKKSRAMCVFCENWDKLVIIDLNLLVLLYQLRTLLKYLFIIKMFYIMLSLHPFKFCIFSLSQFDVIFKMSIPLPWK